MRRVFIVFTIVLSLCSVCWGADLSPEKALEIAQMETSDPIVGVWKMYFFNFKEEAVAHVAIIPNTDEKREGWEYIVIMLENSSSFNRGAVKMVMNHTENPGIYWAKTQEQVGFIRSSGNGPIFYSEGLLDMIRIQDQEGHAPVTHMIKVKDYVYVEPVQEIEENIDNSK